VRWVENKKANGRFVIEHCAITVYDDGILIEQNGKMEATLRNCVLRDERTTKDVPVFFFGPNPGKALIRVTTSE
jgi:hypothetical protein